MVFSNQSHHFSCTYFWDTYTSRKVEETPYSNTFSESRQNNKVGIALHDISEVHYRIEVEDNQKKSNSGYGKASLKKETELNENADSLQNSIEMTSGKALASPQEQHFF